MEKFSGFYGISVYSESLAFLIKRPRLCIYYIYSIIVSILVFIGGFIASYRIIHTLSAKVLLYFNVETYDGWIKNIVSGFTYLGFILIFYFLFLCVLSIISMPFMDFLSAAIEREVTGKSDEAPLWCSVKNGVICSSFMMLRQLLIMILALPLILIPVVGTIIYFLINSWYLAYAYLDLPMARRGWRFKEKSEFLNGFALSRLFLGCVIYTLSMIPVLNFFIIPWATSASTFLFLKILNFKKNNECELSIWNH